MIVRAVCVIHAIVNRILLETLNFSILRMGLTQLHALNA